MTLRTYIYSFNSQQFPHRGPWVTTAYWKPNYKDLYGLVWFIIRSIKRYKKCKKAAIKYAYLIDTPYIQNPLDEEPVFFPATSLWKERKRSLGTPANLVFYGLIFLLSIPAEGILLTGSVATKPRPSVVHNEPGEERYHGSAKFKFDCYLPRPLEAISRCLEQNWDWDNLQSMFKRRFGAIGMEER